MDASDYQALQDGLDIDVLEDSEVSPVDNSIEATDESDQEAAPTVSQALVNSLTPAEIDLAPDPETSDLPVGTVEDEQQIEYIEETYIEEFVLDNYDIEYLEDLYNQGAKFYAVLSDETEVEVEYNDIQIPVEQVMESTIRLSDLIANATGQHFWDDDNGAHVAQVSKEDWAEAVEDEFSDLSLQNPYHNILLNSEGILLRRALLNLFGISRLAISFYDGTGNTSNNITATFGSAMAQIGKTNSNHVVITSNGVTAYKGDGTLDELTAIVDGANLKNSTITGSKIASSTIENSNIKDGTIAGTKIASSTIENSNIKDGTIAGTKIASSTIENSNIKDGTIAGTKIQDSAITGSKIASSTIENSNIKDGTITGAKIQGSTLTNIPYAEIDQLKTRNVTADAIQAATGFVASLATNSITAAKLVANQGIIDNLETNFAHIQNGVIDNANINVANVNGLSANYAHITNGVIDNAKIGHADVNGLSANYASVGALSAETARIDTLVANTADLATIRANAAKVTNLTAAELEADHATVGSLDTNYAQIDMANVNNAWIQNGTIKDAAISDGMINSVSANKLTAGTIDASNITVTNLNADNITTGTINGQRIGAGSLSLDKLSEDVYTETEVDSIVSNLQTQIDGAIETWTGTTIPTLQNAPASSWTTNSVKDTHVGDVYFIVNSQSNQNGYNYRFTKSGTGNNVTYSWQLIKDSDVTNALQRLTTAEGKITTFDSDISQLKTDTGTLTTKTTSLETRMGNAEADILDKVDTTTFNEVSDTVDSHSQSITQMSNTLSNKADSSTVSSLTTRVSKTEQDISGITSKVGSLETTVETKADGSTVETINSKVNTISDTVDGHTQNISSIVSTQTQINYELDKTIVETVRLYTIRSSTDIPSLPTTPILSGTGSSDSYLDNTGNALLDSSNNPIGSDVWSITKPSYNSSKPNYFYCYQHKHVDGSYTWSNVVRDNATTESQNLGHVTSENLTTVTTRVNNISDTVDGHTSQLSTTTTSLTTLRTEFDNLEIGGRNLLKNTEWNSNSISLFSQNGISGHPLGSYVGVWYRESAASVAMTNDGYLQVSTEQTSTRYGIVQDVYLEKGIYILSAKSGANGFRIAFDSTIWPSNNRMTIEQPYTRDYIVIEVPSDAMYRAYIDAHNTANITAPTGNYLKLEKGNKPTDWSPAPEDLEDYADNAANAVPRMAKINMAQRTFTTAQWKTYGAYGHTESWTTGSSYNNSHLRIGDRAYLTGTISDQMLGSATIIGKVTSVDPAGSGTSYVQMQSEQLIFGGDAVSAIQTSLSETQTDYATFKQTTQNFESTIGSTYATKEELTTTVEQTTQQYVDVEAEPFIIDDDGINAPLRSIEANGWSEQFSTTGKNLLPNNAMSQTINGVTFTVNADGSITVNGTASAGTSFDIKTGISLPSATYTLSSVTNVPSDVYLSIQTDGGNHNVTLNKNSETFSAAPSGKSWIYISSGTVLNNLTFYPQLELGSTATAYEPYTGGAPSPSPDYPQEIKVARGRNLLDESTLRQGDYNNTLSIRVSQDISHRVRCKAGETYAISLQSAPSNFFIFASVTNDSNIKIQTDEAIRNGGGSYTVKTDGYLTLVFGYQWVGESTLTITPSFVSSLHPQLELGSTPTPYVPYGYVGMEVQGFNLWNEETEPGYIGQDGVYVNNANNWCTKSFIPVFPNITYFLNSDTGVRLCFYGVDKQFLSWGIVANNQEFVVPSDVHYIKFFRGQALYTKGEICINFSDTSRNGQYEPYYHTTTPIPLPERGWVGSLPDGTADVLTLDLAGKCEWGLKMDEDTLAGDEDWHIDSTGTRNRFAVSGYLSAHRIRNNGSRKVVMLMSAFAVKWHGEAYDASWDNVGYIYSDTYNEKLYIHAYEYDTVADFKAVLAQNPVTVLYPLATPVTEQRGYLNMPEVYPGCTVSIPELDEVGVSYWTPASKSLVDNTRLLEERISNAETSIDQNKDQIALRAKSSDVYTKTQTDGLISTEVSNRNSAIEQSAAAINLSVSQNYTTKTDFNNLEIGGRNLLLDTTDFGTAWYTAKSKGTTVFEENGIFYAKLWHNDSSSWTQYVRQTVTFELDTPYTLSLLVRKTNTDGVDPRLGIRNDRNAAITFFTPTTGCVISNTEWKRYTFTVNKVHASSASEPLSIYALFTENNGALGPESAIQIAKVKLEKGNKDTDWTPAPEDLEAYTDTQVNAAKAAIKVTTDGISSEVSKISSAKYVNSTTTAGWTLDNIKTYSAEGVSTSWSVTSTANIRVGDTVYIKNTDTTRQCQIYVKVTVTNVNSSTSINAISHGYEDVLPIDTIKSTINQSADSVKIQARHVEIDGAAIFSNSNFRAAADAAYDTKGSAAAVQTNLDNLEIGGTNLLRNTANPKVGTSFSTETWIVASGGNGTGAIVDISDSPISGVSQAFRISGNTSGNRDWVQSVYSFELAKNGSTWLDKKWIFSTYARAIGSSCKALIRVWTGTQHFYYDETVETTWTRIEVPVVLTGSIVGTDIPKMQFGLNGAGSIEYIAPKLEQGTKATDWTPAPEDVDSAIGTAKTEAINSANGSTDTKLQSYSTTTQMNSAIGTAKTEAINASYANYGYKYHKDIIIYGDSDKYYPVYFNNNQSDYSQDVPHDLLIKRGYSEQAPSDWYTSTHKGSLTLRVRWNYGGWGGATYNCQVYEWSEQYSTIVGDILVGNKSGMNSTIYLRGGGTTGALYHLYSDVAFDTTWGGATFPYIGTTTPGTVYMQSGTYTWTVDNPLTTPNRTHILSLAAVTEEQYIYISKASGTNSVASTDIWVTANSDSQNTWTTKRPTYNSSYPVLFVAKQKRTTTGHIICTTPVKDDTTTIIDGGHITTGAIDASKVTVNNIDASKITTGSLSADRIKANVISAVNNGTGTINADKINVSALSIGFSQLTDTPAFATADQLSTVIDGQNSVNDRVDESIVNTKILYTTRDVSTLPDAPNTPIISDSNISGAYLDSSSNLLLDSSGNAIMSKTWTVSRPSYSQEEPYYFYCYQYEHADGSYTWSNVMRDDATNESFKVLSSRVEIVCSSINYDNSTASLLAKLYVNNAETSGNHYQWFRDGAILTNQTNQTLTVTASMGINHLYSCTVDY